MTRITMCMCTRCRPVAADMAVDAVNSAVAMFDSLTSSMGSAQSPMQAKAFIEVMAAALQTIQDANIILLYVGDSEELQRQMHRLQYGTSVFLSARMVDSFNQNPDEVDL